MSCAGLGATAGPVCCLDLIATLIAMSWRAGLPELVLTEGQVKTWKRDGGFAGHCMRRLLSSNLCCTFSCTIVSHGHEQQQQAQTACATAERSPCTASLCIPALCVTLPRSSALGP